MPADKLSVGLTGWLGWSLPPSGSVSSRGPPRMCGAHCRRRADPDPVPWRRRAARTNFPDAPCAEPRRGLGPRFPVFLWLRPARPSSGSASQACRRLRKPCSPGRLSVSAHRSLRRPRPCSARARPCARSIPWFPARMGAPRRTHIRQLPHPSRRPHLLCFVRSCTYCNSGVRMPSSVSPDTLSTTRHSTAWNLAT